MDILKLLRSRYSTKEFDSSVVLKQDDINNIKEILQLAPSSTNIQPWHFIIVTSEDGKRKVARSTHGMYSFNENKILDSSATILFCSRVDLTSVYLNHVLDKEESDGRFKELIQKEKNHGGRSMFASMHKYEYKDFQHWAEKQLYINLGNFLVSIAALGFDSLAMEGLDMKVLDDEFNLRARGFSCVIGVAVGKAKDTDFNKSLPKSRLSTDEIITLI